MRWSRENYYDALIATESQRQGVPAALIKAVIGQESAFVPTAFRQEPKINDASRGLMQLLLKTAKALGWTGAPEGLFDPATNIYYGTKLLAENLSRTSGNIPNAVSAYNGGFRANLGFGAPLPNGQYGNQDYVTKVLLNLKYFQNQERPVPTPETGAASMAGTVAGAVAAAVLLGILWFMQRSH